MDLLTKTFSIITAIGISITSTSLSGCTSQNKKSDPSQSSSSANLHVSKENKSRWDRIQDQIESAVVNGELTKEEAKQAYKNGRIIVGAVNKKIITKDEAEKMFDSWERVEKAVKNGLLSRKDADKIYEDALKKLAPKKDPTPPSKEIPVLKKRPTSESAIKLNLTPEEIQRLKNLQNPDAPKTY